MPFAAWVYDEDSDAYLPEDQLPAGALTRRLSPEGLRARLQAGRKIPDWFSYPDVIAELTRANPPCKQQGFALFFTGLSGSGKSTLANVIMVRLMELGTRPVTVLDGDIVFTGVGRRIEVWDRARLDADLEQTKMDYSSYTDILKEFGL